MVQDSKFVRWSSAFFLCLCLQSRKDVSCSFISSSINFLVQKYVLLLPAGNYKAQSGLAIKIEIYIGK